jgi:hypothetical protein
MSEMVRLHDEGIIPIFYKVVILYGKNVGLNVGRGQNIYK